MCPSAIVDKNPASTDTEAATILTSPLSINGVPAQRAKAPQLSGALAPQASSSMFKGPVTGKPQAKRWDHIFSEESRSRKGSTLKNTAKYLGNPGMISLGGGLPTSEYFPFESIDIKVPRPPQFSESKTRQTGQTLHVGKHDYRDGESLYDIHIAFNYGQSMGSVQLLRFVTEHTEIVHNPPYQDWNCALTVGSTSALDMTVRMLCNRGDTILTEEYTFVSAVETVLPMGIKMGAVAIDGQGLRADALDDVLTNWDSSKSGSPKPHVLYTVPTGQNPTGATQSEQRRREIYAIAQKHNLFIIEDEPYYFLQMNPYVSSPDGTPPPQPENHEEFIHSLVPSYLSMDLDGRVMRMDSFSKVIAPGTRVGWITASEQIVERYVLHGQVSTQNPSGVSQLVLYKLLEDGWGHAGYLDWLAHIRREYSNRRDIIVRAAYEFLPTEVADWKPPMAGMFFWVGVNWRRHPRAAKGTHVEDSGVNGNAVDEIAGSHKVVGVKQQMLDIEEEVFQAGIERGVLTAKGSWFRAEQDHGTEMFFRMTFAAASETDIKEAVRRFGQGLRAVFQLDA